MLRTVNDQSLLWDVILPSELLVLPDELARVDRLLDDRAFFAPFAPFFDPRIGRPSVPMETYLRMMFLKFRYRLGFDRCAAKSVIRFPGNGLPNPVRHPGSAPDHADETHPPVRRCCGHRLNEALLAKAVGHKLLRTDKVRADTTVVDAAVSYPTDSGLLAKAVGSDRRHDHAYSGRRRGYPHPGT